MSLGGSYQTSKLGTTTVTVTSATATRIQLVDPTATNFQPASFAVQVKTSAARILQGDSSVVATATNAFYLSTGVYWRIDVDDASEAYISVLGDGAGTIEITLVSRVE